MVRIGRRCAHRLTLVLLLLGTGCAPRAAQRADVAEGPLPLALSGQRVLVLPVQQLVGLRADQGERLNAELLFALGERDGGVEWVSTAELRRVLQRSPGVARSPESLPADPRLRPGARRVGEALASELRRFAALVDARLVLVPQQVRLEAGTTGEGARLRLAAALVDARLGDVLWYGEALGEVGQGEGWGVEPSVFATAAGALAERMVAAPAREGRP